MGAADRPLPLSARAAAPVMVHQRGGQTFYRLRAAGGEARAVCRRLRAAGQPCMDVN